VSEFKDADLDGDGTIGRHEFMAWYLKKNKKAEQSGKDVPPPSSGQLWALFLAGAIPFVGFGFLDNAIMLTAGDMIEDNLGAKLGIGTLAAAGLGNMLSDVAGLGLSGGMDCSIGCHLPTVIPCLVLLQERSSSGQSNWESPSPPLPRRK
jgi:hypothetical protein